VSRRAPALEVAAFVLLLALPFGLANAYYVQVLFRVFIFAALGLAWNLVGGYAGQLSLGHVAYFGLGAYAFALLKLDLGWSPWLGVAGGAVLSMAAAFVIGSVTFRLRGPYFVLATIAAAEILRLLALNLTHLTRGAVGLLAPALFPGRQAGLLFYLSAVALAAAAYGFNRWTERSRYGYSLMAIREDEDTAMAVGIDPARYKLLALLPSALITAVAGSLYASSFQFIGPDSFFSIDVSNQAAIVAMLGGAGTPLGPVIGSVILTLASEAFRNVFKEAHLLIYGLLVVFVVLFLPGGVLRLRRIPRARARRVAGRGVEHGVP
jgi:branched-chain amino acid transport system permease protein